MEFFIYFLFFYLLVSWLGHLIYGKEKEQQQVSRKGRNLLANLSIFGDRMAVREWGAMSFLFSVFKKNSLLSITIRLIPLLLISISYFYYSHTNIIFLNMNCN